MTPPTACDLAIIGGGLSGGLIALAAHRARPTARILLVEAKPALGGNHLWTFLDSDIDKADRALLEPLISYGWRNLEVMFPGYRRTISDGVYAIRSDRFDQALREILPADFIVTGLKATGVAPDGIVLEDGSMIAAGGVIDARGAADLSLIDTAWRKFVGYELQLAGPHSVRQARLIDAGVESQDEGLSFLTLMPLDTSRLFLEDVHYAADTALDVQAYARRIFNLAAKLGWKIIDSARGQAGVIPIAMGGDFEAYWQSGGAGIAKAGLRAGLFHPVTGGSLADAARTARLVAGLSDWSGAALHKALHAHARKAWNSRDFYRRFTTQMMRGNPPAEQYRLFESLYDKEPALVARFHGLRLTMVDRLALSLGDGPMPIASMLGGRKA
jgi:lycopene beta-cyclase